jgi:hypothetical protein
MNKIKIIPICSIHGGTDNPCTQCHKVIQVITALNAVQKAYAKGRDYDTRIFNNGVTEALKELSNL